MKLKLKEDPKEWRKPALFGALGLAVLATVLRWRHVLSSGIWLGLLGCLTVLALSAWLRPRWFRGYYRVATRVGFFLGQGFGQGLLVILFLVIVTPLGLALRVFGKDLLRLKRSREVATYWTDSKETGPLDRLF